MHVITGLFSSPSAASSAVRRLEEQAFPVKDISLVAADQTKMEDFGIETKSKVAEGAAIGAGFGGAVGALIAGFTAVGAVVTGGAALLAAGPIVAALAGAGVGAAAGGAVGTAVGLAIPEHEIKFYDEAIRKGSVLVGVHCEDSDRRDLVKEILEGAGATKISHA